MKIVFLDVSTIGVVPNMDEIKVLGEYVEYSNTLPDQRLDRIGDADIVIVNKVVIDADIMSACPSLKLICVAATGINNIDLKYAEKQGIQVKNVAGYSTSSVAMITFALIFDLMTKIRYYNEYVQSGAYSSGSLFTYLGFPFHELTGKQFGIVGLGTIGLKVASIAETFGAEVVYYSTSGKNLEGPYPHFSLDQLLQTSDIVSVHAPLNDTTFNLIDKAQLIQMKSTAYLINVGRGGIINEEALAEAIDMGTIAGAGLDVYSREPLPEDNPLLKVRNKDRLLLLPHIAWSSIESRALLVNQIASNIKNFILGLKNNGNYNN